MYYYLIYTFIYVQVLLLSPYICSFQISNDGDAGSIANIVPLTPSNSRVQGRGDHKSGMIASVVHRICGVMLQGLETCREHGAAIIRVKLIRRTQLWSRGLNSFLQHISSADHRCRSNQTDRVAFTTI